MSPDRSSLSIQLRVGVAATWIIVLTSCATQPTGRPEDAAAAKSLREARSPNLAAEVRAADYLHAAALSAPALGAGTEPTAARQTYNSAASELTILLKSAEGGRLWNHPLTLAADRKSTR